MKAMDLSVHNMDRDNNNDIRVEDLSLAMAGAVEAVIRSQESDLTKRNSEKLRALLPHLDIAAHLPGPALAYKGIVREFDIR